MANKRRRTQKPSLESAEPLAKKICTKMDKPLSVGMRGVFFTTASGKRASHCAEEAILLIKEYLVKSKEPSDSTLFEKTDAARTSESMKSCVEEFSEEHADKQELFCVATGVRNTLFVVVPEADPVDLVMHILNDVKAGSRRPSHLLQRLLPCQISCSATVKHIANGIAELLKRKFTLEVVEQKPSFAVVFQHRNNATISSQEVYDVVVAGIKALSPESKVCLTSPKLYILVNIVKTVCCLSVIENYNELKQFNWVNI